MKNTNGHQQHLNQVTLIGMLVAIGIVFGDIGASPLYTFSAVIGSKPVEPLLALGGLSAIFWTLFFQTTVKYVVITLTADNKTELRPPGLLLPSTLAQHPRGRSFRPGRLKCGDRECAPCRFSAGECASSAGILKSESSGYSSDVLITFPPPSRSLIARRRICFT